MHCTDSLYLIRDRKPDLRYGQYFWYAQRTWILSKDSRRALLSIILAVSHLLRNLVSKNAEHQPNNLQGCSRAGDASADVTRLGSRVSQSCHDVAGLQAFRRKHARCVIVTQ